MGRRQTVLDNGHVTKPLQECVFKTRIGNNLKFSGENDDSIFKIGRLFDESKLSRTGFITAVMRNRFVIN